MTVKIDGTNTVANPAFTGADTDTGLQCGTNEVKLVTGGTARAQVDSAGKLAIGTDTLRSNLYASNNYEPTVQIETSGTLENRTLSLGYNNGQTAAAGPILNFVTSGGTTNGSNTIVRQHDELGVITFTGTDGTEPLAGATIVAYCDGTPGTGDMPGRLEFGTTADGASSQTLRMMINNQGYVGIGGITPAVRHHVSETANANIDFIDCRFGAHTASIQVLRDATNASSAYNFLVMESGSIGLGGTFDYEFIMRGDGNAFADGTWTGGGADYAEYFEWSDGNTAAEDRRGISVVLDGGQIREAVAGEDPIGVISGNPSVVGDAAWNHWSGKYLCDDFGTYQRETYSLVEWQDEDGENKSYPTDCVPEDVTVPDDAVTRTTDDNGNVLTRRTLNPSYDPNVDYVSRENRPEWDCVGLMGKLRLRKGQVTGARWIKMRDVSDSVEEWLVR